MRPTWTFSAAASSCSRPSRTRPSPRWWPASRSTCSSRTRRSRSWPGSPPHSGRPPFSHSDKVWLEYPDIPLGFLRAYIAKVQRGQTLERPMEAVIAERERIVEEYSELIDNDEDQATFQAKLGLARTVFPYVENHNFYVEHWGHSVIWRKMRDLGRVLVAAEFFADVG